MLDNGTIIDACTIFQRLQPHPYCHGLICENGVIVDKYFSNGA